MKNRIPETLEECVEAMIEVNLKQIDCLRKEDMNKYHFSTGMQMRNEWGLWDKNSTLYKHFKERFGLWHADDTSSLIMTCFKNAINGTTWEINSEVKRYLDHWERLGVGPDGIKK